MEANAVGNPSSYIVESFFIVDIVAPFKLDYPFLDWTVINAYSDKKTLDKRYNMCTIVCLLHILIIVDQTFFDMLFNILFCFGYFWSFIVSFCMFNYKIS